MDEEVFEELNRFRWSGEPQRNTVYVRRAERGKTIKMHRVIMNVTDPKCHIDHINGDGLDNRKENLRMVTNHQNRLNSRTYKTNQAGYKGVSPIQTVTGLRWRSTITLNGTQHHLGCFDTPTEAALAYDLKSLELFGDYACPNFGNGVELVSKLQR